MLMDAKAIPNVPPPDRICHRSKLALVCWFLEYAPGFLDGVIESVQAPTDIVHRSDESQQSQAAPNHFSESSLSPSEEFHVWTEDEYGGCPDEDHQ
jgi:hypothetical protein